MGVAIGLFVALALWAPVAGAAPPANDDFAAREALSGLPVNVQRSNVGATKEAGEFIPGLAPAGHSIWFEWDATSTGWVTIGACDNDFPSILAVFTGTEVDKLTSLASGNAKEGPDCPYSQKQYTFKAQSGSKYEIAVDGNVFHMPETSTPVTEGEVRLKIESTPTPANDDFADAAPLQGRVDEEPGGDRFYFASVSGHNWTATTEAGEPSVGSGSGASVWYSWTPPESATYMLGGPCCGVGLSWSLYSGEALGGLSRMLTTTGSAQVTLSSGATYRIQVYGTPDLAIGEPSMASFQFIASARLQPLPRPTASSPGPQPDLLAPETTFLQLKKPRKPTTKHFAFRSSEYPSTFLCRLDDRPFAVCGASKTYVNLKPGRHRFEVAAVDAAGNKDATPAVTHFRVPKPKPHKAKN